MSLTSQWQWWQPRLNYVFNTLPLFCLASSIFLWFCWFYTLPFSTHSKMATTFCIVCCFNVNGKFAHLINSSWPMASKSKKVNGYKYYNNKMCTEVSVFQVYICYVVYNERASGNESKRDDHNYIIYLRPVITQLNVFSSPLYSTEAII